MYACIYSCGCCMTNCHKPHLLVVAVYVMIGEVYHARVRVVLQLLRNGVEAHQVSQVLVIGAGLDTFVDQTVHAINPSVKKAYSALRSRRWLQIGRAHV